MTSSEITSVHNPRVKQWAQLLTKKGRDQQGKFLLEGSHLTEEALKSGMPVETVLYSLEKGRPDGLLALGQAGGIEWIGLSEPVLAKCTETGTPQGIVAVCAKPDWSADGILEQVNALVVVVDGVQDPGNLGTIVRSADAVGASGVLLGKGTVDLYNPKTVRATMGSLFHLPVVECDLYEVLPAAVGKGIHVVGTRLGASKQCYEVDFRPSTWLLVGNEGSGVSPELASYVTEDIVIPMRGKAESLNVAMATTVLLYEAMRQRYY